MRGVKHIFGMICTHGGGQHPNWSAQTTEAGSSEYCETGKNQTFVLHTLADRDSVGDLGCAKQGGTGLVFE